MISEDEIADLYQRIGQHDAHIPDAAMPTLSPTPWLPAKFVQHTTDANRRKRRALIKAIGARQFKKLYKKAQA